MYKASDVLWRGKRISELSRSELEAAFMQLLMRLHETETPENRKAVAQSRARAFMRRGNQ